MQISKLEERQMADPLAISVKSLVDCMRIDFGERFTRVFKDDEQLRQLKRRLYKSLMGFSDKDITDGYESAIKAYPHSVPSVPSIESCCREIKRERLKQEQEQARNHGYAALPKPSYEPVSDDILKLMHDGTTKSKGTEQERIARLEAIASEHDKLISLSKAQGLIKPAFQSEQNCRYPGCQHYGSISSSTKGGENWYCKEHFRG